MRKYRNKPAVEDGYRFDSQMELARYKELKLLQAANEISGLEIHPKFPLSVNGQTVCIYIADFAYNDVRRGTLRVVEDVKGMKTALYSLKKKLMKACHGIEIQEIRRRTKGITHAST